MKKSVYSSLLLLFFTFAVVVGYQNCGAVGGTSPFSYDPGPETDPGDLESGNLLKLSLASAPTISGRELSVRFETCSYRPFNNHHIYMRVNYSNGSTHTWIESCATNTNLTQTLPETGIPTTFTATLVGIASTGEEVYNNTNAFIDHTAIIEGLTYPSSTTVVTKDYPNLHNNAATGYQDITVANTVGTNSYPYSAIRGRLEFKVQTALTVGYNYGIMEFFPYKTSGSYRSEYQLAANREQNPDSYNLLYCGTSNTCVFEKRYVSLGAFVQGAFYYIDFAFRSDGYYMLKLYKASNNLQLYAHGGYLDSFTQDNLGIADPVIIRLGKTSYVSNSVFSGLSNIKFQYRACGYVNGSTPDPNCNNIDIPIGN